MMRRLVSFARVALGLTLVAGCGKPFDVKTAPGFVALENQHDFDWRATATWASGRRP